MKVSDLERLQLTFPPPAGLPGFDWAAFEPEFGAVLPADYKQLIDAYGSCRFNDFLSVFLPSSPHEFLDLDARRRCAEANVEWLLEDEVIGTAALPMDPARLLPVAGTDNGNTVSWDTGSATDPDRWTVVVDQARSDGWYNFDGGIVALLVAVFVDGIQVPVFPEHLTRRPSTLTPDGNR